MQIQNKTLFIILIVVIILVVLGGVFYYLVISKNIGGIPVIGNRQPSKPSQKQPEPPVAPDPVKQLAITKQDYPLVITGVIRFFDTARSYKATLKADNGTEYILYPAQPRAIYESLGAKNGSRVQVNGKIIGGASLAWALLKPL